MKRQEGFLTELYESLIQPNNERENDIRWLEEYVCDKENDPTPSYSNYFNELKQRNLNQI